MTFFRFVIFIFLLYLFHVFIKKLLKSFTSKEYTKRQNSTNKLEEKELVKDPQCGIYVVKNIASKLKHGNETLYFCSKECMDKYRRESLGKK